MTSVASIRWSTTRHLAVVQDFAPEHLLTVPAQLADSAVAVRAFGHRRSRIGASGAYTHEPL